MRIGLINAFDSHDRKQSYFPALGLGYLASYVRAHDDERHEFVVAESSSELVSARPELVGISTTTQAFELSKGIAREVKRYLGAGVILGGVHITALPETLPEEVDVAVLGEGEETFLELVRLYRRYGGWPVSVLRDLANIVYWDDGKRIENPRSRVKRPLDSLPFPDRDIMKSVLFQGGAHVIGSRGCPYDCAFCYNRSFWLQVSAHSPARFAEEIIHVLDRYSPDWIYVYDDLFVATVRRLREIVDVLEKRGIPERTSFRVYLRANMLTEEVCCLLRRMNTRAVDIGFESNSTRVLKLMQKKVTPEANQACLDLCSRFGIGVYGTFIMGWPQERVEDAEATIRFIEQNRAKLRSALTIPLYAYPGTWVWEHAVARGLVSAKMDFNLIQTSTVEYFDIEQYIMLNDEMSKSQLARALTTCFALQHEILYGGSGRREAIIVSGMDY
jgi:anaerobic magnesium-protoporphyrin IX monomethyl ester cyclase